MIQQSCLAVVLIFGAFAFAFAFANSRCLAADTDSAATVLVAPQSADRLVVIIRGASGTSEYGQLFDLWSDRWEAAATTGGARVTRVGLKTGADGTAADASNQPGDGDRISFELALREAAAQATS